MLTLLLSSLVFTGFTGRDASIRQTSNPTELLYCSNNRIEKNTTACYAVTAQDQAFYTITATQNNHACFISHHNRFFKIQLKATALLTEQFIIWQQLALQITIHASSPEHFSIS